ncbi:MAG: hypothetical protein ABI051_09195 [Vicinamibacterales bacterium]
MPRQVVGLIESPTNQTQRMERHRHDRISVVENFGARVSHQACERRRDHPPAVIFEGVD